MDKNGSQLIGPAIGASFQQFTAACALVSACVSGSANHPTQNRHPSGYSGGRADGGCHPQSGQSFPADSDSSICWSPLPPCGRELK